jgi:hypothetical protein
VRGGVESAGMSLRLRWLVPVLAMAFTAMMAVVILRAGTTRLHYDVSQLDQQAAVLRQEAREGSLELARLRNPAMIRAKLAELRLEGISADGGEPGG